MLPGSCAARDRLCCCECCVRVCCPTFSSHVGLRFTYFAENGLALQRSRVVRHRFQALAAPHVSAVDAVSVVLAPLALSAYLVHVSATADPKTVAAWSSLYPCTDGSLLPPRMVTVVYANRRVLYPARLVFGYVGDEPSRTSSQQAADLASQAWFGLVSIADARGQSAAESEATSPEVTPSSPAPGDADAAALKEPSPKKRRTTSPLPADAGEPAGDTPSAATVVVHPGAATSPAPAATGTDMSVPAASSAPSTVTADELLRCKLFPLKRPPVVPGMYAAVKAYLPVSPQQYSYRPTVPRKAHDFSSTTAAADPAANEAPKQARSSANKGKSRRSVSDVLNLCVRSTVEDAARNCETAPIHNCGGLRWNVDSTATGNAAELTQMARRDCLAACVSAQRPQHQPLACLQRAGASKGCEQSAHGADMSWRDNLDTVPSGAEWLPEPSVDSCMAALETIVQIMRSVAWQDKSTGSPMSVNDFLSIAAPNHDTKKPVSVIDLLDVPAVLIGGHEERVSLSPDAINHWDTLLLSPYSKKNNVQYYAVVPNNQRICTATHEYLKEISAIYHGCNLGMHQPAEFARPAGHPAGVVLADVPLGDPTQALSTYYLRIWDTIAEAIIQAAALERSGAGRDLSVVYIVSPFSKMDGRAQRELQTCFLKLLEKLPGKLRCRTLLEVVSVPAVIGLGISSRGSRNSDLRRTAFSIFLRSNGVDANHADEMKVNSADNAYRPLFVLAPQHAEPVWFTCSGAAIGRQLPDRIIHLAFSIDPSQEWVCVVWTDALGELLETQSFPRSDDTSSGGPDLGKKVQKRIWEATKAIFANVAVRWRLVICKHGSVSKTETAAWGEIFEDEFATLVEDGPGIVGMSVVAIRPETELQLLYRHESLRYSVDAPEARGASLLPQTRTLLPSPHMLPSLGSAPGTAVPLATALVQVTPAPLAAWRSTPAAYRGSQKQLDSHTLMVSILYHAPPPRKPDKTVRHPLDSSWYVSQSTLPAYVCRRWPAACLASFPQPLLILVSALVCARARCLAALAAQSDSSRRACRRCLG